MPILYNVMEQRCYEKEDVEVVGNALEYETLKKMR